MSFPPASPAGALPTAGAPSLPESVSRSFSSSRLVSALLTLIAGVLSGISATLAWWTDSFGSGNIHFLPGGSLTGSGVGGTVTASYASVGFGPVGALYEFVLAAALTLLVLALITGALAVFGSLNRIPSLNRKGTVRGLVITVLLISLAVTVIVPTVQPYTLSKSSGGCAAGWSPQSPCSSFWGAGTQSGTSYTWGADAGFYLMVATVVLLVAALVYWVRAWSEPWGRPPVRIGGAVATTPGPWVNLPPAPAQGTDPVERLLQLKQLLDSGHISPAEFQQAKSQLFSGPSSPPPPASSSSAGGVEETLARLKAMRDAGQLTDTEYGEIRTRVLARL